MPDPLKIYKMQRPFGSSVIKETEQIIHCIGTGIRAKAVYYVIEVTQTGYTVEFSKQW